MTARTPTSAELRPIVMDRAAAAGKGGGSAFAAHEMRVLSGREPELRRAITEHDRRALWIVGHPAYARSLIASLAAAPPAGRLGDLILLVPPRLRELVALEAWFERVVPGPSAMVPLEELAEILGTVHPEDYCVGADRGAETKTITLWRGDLSTLVVPLLGFPVRAGVRPTARSLGITDTGQTLLLGRYEASIDALLLERDAEYRRRANRRRRAEDRSLGGSIRRLRMLRGARRGDFPGVTEKTIARIERGETERPHAGTLRRIAKVLGVTVEDLREY